MVTDSGGLWWHHDVAEQKTGRLSERMLEGEEQRETTSVLIEDCTKRLIADTHFAKSVCMWAHTHQK